MLRLSKQNYEVPPCACLKTPTTSFALRSSHDAVKSCRREPTILRSTMPPSSEVRSRRSRATGLHSVTTHGDHRCEILTSSAPTAVFSHGERPALTLTENTDINLADFIPCAFGFRVNRVTENIPRILSALQLPSPNIASPPVFQVPPFPHLRPSATVFSVCFGMYVLQDFPRTIRTTVLPSHYT
jgi:hypothetical protein